MLVVVVLPWVPATTRGERPARNSSRSSAAKEVKGMRSSRTRSISGLPRERVADDDEVGRGREVRFRVRLEDRNAERAKQIAHRRISGLVGAGDAMALELQQAGKRRHGRAADADEMDVTRSCGHEVT